MPMPASGDFINKVIRCKQTETTETTWGQKEETFNEDVEYWCAIEELTAQEIANQGMIQSQATTRIRIRNHVTLEFKDRLKDKEIDDVYLIDGINYGIDELIVLCHRQGSGV